MRIQVIAATLSCSAALGATGYAQSLITVGEIAAAGLSRPST